jgi:hypothetical protein
MVKLGANCRAFLLVRRVDFFLERVLRSPVITAAHASCLTLRIAAAAMFSGRRNSYTQRALVFSKSHFGNICGQYLQSLPRVREDRGRS